MTFDVAKWKGEGGDYTLSVIDGKVVPRLEPRDLLDSGRRGAESDHAE